LYVPFNGYLMSSSTSPVNKNTKVSKTKSSAPAAAQGSGDLAKYQKMTDREHILNKPDTYIGSVETTETIDYVIEGNTLDTHKMVRKPFTYVPGLYKLFDEGLVNCRDHVIRQSLKSSETSFQVTNIEIEISKEDGTITLLNDGDGIDVAQHPEHKLWIPEMIFGHLRTSTNYDEDKKEKIVGGKNGFGFKLVLIWSVWGRIETVDHTRGLKYTQEFHDNLTRIDPPSITKSKVKPYTKVSFRPDYARFGCPGNNLTPDMLALFMKRVYDIAAVTDKTVKVKYNGEIVPVKHFQQYVDLYIGGKGEVKRIYESPNPRWEYVVCLTPTDEFCHVSFVNGIYTQRGGKHVEYIVNQIVRKLAALIKTKKKVDVKPNTIKEQLMLFLRCDIENPSFSSQTKDELGTAVSNFGSTCSVSDEFIEKLAKMGVMEAACALTEVKDTKAAKKTDGTKVKTVRGIPKLIDANYAGTDKSGDCTIIFCEGDSAKAGIVSGLTKEDRNYIGVYPMKGKIFNVRGETTKRISENHEISEIKQILGLENGRKYTADDVSTRLRYGKVLFMTDQDLDGSHIKGLGINLFQSEWPTLAEIPGFIGFMNTPIIKAKKGTQERVFYNEGEFEQWKQDNSPSQEGGSHSSVVPNGWNIKYYKGLGTSTGKEFKEYFERKKIVGFTHNGQESDDAIDMVFNKKRADDRKTWLSGYARDAYLDTMKPSVSYEEFISRELIHFSKYDCDRSIPNVMDGLKISLRKILYAGFKKGLKTEIKVAQFSGYVSEHSGYHHGEASLNGAIVGMAQTFVGSNNINIFEPNGQFGCIDPETPVLLWNGSIEKAKNIKVNDMLIGDDGECRIVSKLTQGVDEMYEVTNGNMDSYVVNSHHILTVSFSGHKSIYWKKSSNCWSMSFFDDASKSVKHKNVRTDRSSVSKDDAYKEMVEFSKTIDDNNVFDINVQQYLALPSSAKKHIKGVINSSVVQWDEKDVPIDPYILGAWLGHANQSCIREECNDMSDHVPIDYIVNSEDVRLKILAGFIDTDGTLKQQKNSYRYEISQAVVRRHILESFRVIAGSLGFRAKIYNTSNTILTLAITGNTIHKIPVKVERKKIHTIHHLRNCVYSHNITVKSIGQGPFCGWNIDKNERFLLGDFTITHNTRLQGGKDSASERYIFTQFNKLTRLIFRPEDDKVLTYLNDDGLTVEPIHYVPIIPMILVNGSKGIGTGFSTDIMCYNPIHIIEYVKEMLANDDGVSVSKVIDPYYQGFKGTIEKATPTKYLIKGTYEVINDKKIRVTELPVGYWTDDFKQHLEALMESVKEKDKDGKETTIPAVIKEYSDMSTDTVVDFTITFTSSISVADYEKKAASEPGCNMLEKLLKLYTTQSTTNMHLFDSKEKLKKYADIYEIIRDYYDVRMEYYALRKNAMLDELRKEMVLLSNRARYITCILNDSLDLRRKGNSVVINTLKQMKFDVVDGDEEFKYLLKMAMDSVTEENVARLLKERDAKTSEYNDLLHTSEKQLWIRDLNELHVEYQRWLSTKSRDESSIEKVSGNVKVASVKKVVRKMIVKQE
jgi:DNA gyrase/topoisomerase IV subunit B